MLQDVKDQFRRDQDEVDQINAEEKRLQSAKAQAKVGSTEARQIDLGIRALHEQHQVFWIRLCERMTMQVEQVERNREEVQSLVEITMETGDEDTEMDTTIVEQGMLPKVPGRAEQQVYE